MKNKKFSFRMYTAWDYEREIEDLDKESTKGWQMIKGGCFHSVFEKDNGIRYRYQLDYNADIDNRMRYIDTFREQGWEYINSTFNGWHYFRKIFNPELSEEEYQIYTDATSLPEIRSRWIRLAKILIILMGIFAVISTVMFIMYPEITRIPTIINYVFMICMMAYGVRKMRRPDKNYQSIHGTTYLVLIIIVLLTCSMLTLKLNSMRPHIDMSLSNDKNVTLENYDLMPDAKFNVKYHDNYYFDIDISCTDVINFILLDEWGKNVYSKSCKGNKLNLDNERLWLTKGNYRVKIQTGSLKTGSYNVNWSVD